MSNLEEKQLDLQLPKGEFLLDPEEIGNYLDVNNTPGSVFVVDIGQPRISSTARAILLASGKGFDEVHFQPWKYIQRYSKRLEVLGCSPRVIINGENKSGGLFLLKETPGGPNDPKENFDPVSYLLEAGVKVDQLRVLWGVREPFSQFESWLKFDPTRSTQLFLEGQNYILSLLENYRSLGIQVSPYIFELFPYYGDSTYLKLLYDWLGLGDKIKLPDGLRFSNNPPVIWHEANSDLDRLGLGGVDVGSSYYQQVIAPVIKKGCFVVAEPKLPNSQRFEENFPLIVKLIGPERISKLKEAASNYVQVATKIYRESLGNGLPPSDQFAEFIKNYQLAIKTL